MLPPFSFRHLMQSFFQADWKKTDFCKHKAFCCAALSELVYDRAPKLTHNRRARFKIHSDFIFPHLINTRTLIDWRKSDEFLGEIQGRWFELRLKHSVILGLITPRVIILAVRGTQDSHDVLLDLRFRKELVAVPNQASLSFHRGFLIAIEECKEPILRELQPYLSNDVSVHLTGHSLGASRMKTTTGRNVYYMALIPI